VISAHSAPHRLRRRSGDSAAIRQFHRPMPSARYGGDEIADRRRRQTPHFNSIAVPIRSPAPDPDAAVDRPAADTDDARGGLGAAQQSSSATGQLVIERKPLMWRRTRQAESLIDGCVHRCGHRHGAGSQIDPAAYAAHGQLQQGMIIERRRQQRDAEGQAVALKTGGTATADRSSRLT